MDADERDRRDAKRERMLDQLEWLMEHGLSLAEISAEVGARPEHLPVLRRLLRRRHGRLRGALARLWRPRTP